MCFNLEYEPSGHEVFLAMTGSGSSLAEEADDTKYSDSDCEEDEDQDSRNIYHDEEVQQELHSSNDALDQSNFKSESSSAIPEPGESDSGKSRKRQGKGKNGNRAQSKQPKPSESAKPQKQPKSQKQTGSGNGNMGRRAINEFCRLFILVCLFPINVVFGSNENPIESFGEAWNRLIGDAWQRMQRDQYFNNLPRLQNRTAIISGSAVIAVGIFLLLIFLGGAFSESVSVSVNSVHEFPRHSNPGFEVNMLNSDSISSHAIGNHNPFQLCWVIDSGASCHLCNDAHRFVNLKPCNVKISTAKSGESILATGIGDVRLNTWDEQGQPVSMILTNVYFVREARRNLLSVKNLAKQKFQTVLPSDAPIFPSGIYVGRQGTRAEQARIPIECVDNLYFIKTSLVDSDLSDDNPWIVWQRRLGFMPLPAIRSLVSRSLGLESLDEVPFPKNFIDENIRLGKAINRDKPDPTPPHTSCPMERVSWDLFGPTVPPSFGGHKYCAVFVGFTPINKRKNKFTNQLLIRVVIDKK
jgi:hypothetical protein